MLSQLSKVPAAQAANPFALSIFTVRPEAKTRLRKTKERVQMRKHILVDELHTLRVRTVTEGRLRSAGIRFGLSRSRACAEKICLAATSGMYFGLRRRGSKSAVDHHRWATNVETP